jgi:6-phosphogluconolactonase
VKRELLTFADGRAMVREICMLVHDKASLAIEASGRFSMALSGGRTPRELYDALAKDYKDGIDWKKTHLFFGDERFVPKDHEQSNFRMADESLFSRVPVPEENVYPIPTQEATPKLAADRYETALREFFMDTEFPRFDLLLLGLGADGHVVSLFPGDAALVEKRRWAVPSVAPDSYAVRERITVTFPVINAADTVVMIVAGEEKRGILGRLLGGNTGIPADQIEPEVRFLIFTDIHS